VQINQGFVREPVYLKRFFDRELAFEETAVVLTVDKLLARVSRGGNCSRPSVSGFFLACPD
jgi:hypothetical protein